jgi:hypothetical protein
VTRSLPIDGALIAAGNLFNGLISTNSRGPCSVEIIRRDAVAGMLLAGSDPRRDGWALAW